MGVVVDGDLLTAQRALRGTQLRARGGPGWAAARGQRRRNSQLLQIIKLSRLGRQTSLCAFQIYMTFIVSREHSLEFKFQSQVLQF